MRHRILNTFTGPFAIIEEDDGSIRTCWVDADILRMLSRSSSRETPRLQRDLAQRLGRYFAGDANVNFGDVPLARDAGAFQRRCWEACRRIPRGERRTYSELAAAAGSPAAARAAGQAMRHNRMAVIVPCHRVVASNGALHGFGGSTDRNGPALSIKRKLLEMEASAWFWTVPGRVSQVERPRSRTKRLVPA